MKTGTLDTRLLEYHIAKRIRQDVAENRVCCASVAVLQHGSLLYREDFGYQRPGSDEPVRLDAIYRIASMTKPVTAVALLQLAQRGVLRLEDEVAKFLPAYGKMPLQSGGFCKTPIRIWHLLTHTSAMEGTPEYKYITHHLKPEDNCSTAASAAFYATLPLPYEPGTYRRYSGRAAFDLLGRILEIATGMELSEYLRENIFVPCGMVDTTFAPSADQWERMVGLHDYNDGKSVAAPTVAGCVVDDCPVTHPLAGGGLISTLDDYIQFAQMLQNKGMTRNGSILDAKWIEEMARPQLPVTLMSESVNQGLGVRVITGDGYPWLADGCFGWSGAYGTHFWVDPANQITAIYMKNSRYDGGSGAITGKHFEEDVFSSII